MPDITEFEKKALVAHDEDFQLAVRGFQYITLMHNGYTSWIDCVDRVRDIDKIIAQIENRELADALVMMMNATIEDIASHFVFGNQEGPYETVRRTFKECPFCGLG